MSPGFQNENHHSVSLQYKLQHLIQKKIYYLYIILDNSAAQAQGLLGF